MMIRKRGMMWDLSIEDTVFVFFFILLGFSFRKGRVELAKCFKNEFS